MPTTQEESSQRLGPERLIKLRTFVEGNSLDPLTYVHLLVIGDAPSPIVVGNELFVSRSDATRWNSGLLGRAALRRAELIAKARAGCHER